MNYSNPVLPDHFALEATRIEAVTVSTGFDDLLDYFISHNHPELDTLIIVTAHDDRKTRLLCQKHGAICVPTDLIQKNGRPFNKGAAINAGFNRFQYYGWRLHMDTDILLPTNCRRMLFNYHQLDTECIYGADRVDVHGRAAIEKSLNRQLHSWGYQINSGHRMPISTRYVDGLYGYVPMGFFQMWHASRHVMYPWSIGTAAHDDICFATLWPQMKRHLLPNVIVTHMLTRRGGPHGNNWQGRRHPRLE